MKRLELIRILEDSTEEDVVIKIDDRYFDISTTFAVDATFDPDDPFGDIQPSAVVLYVNQEL